MQKLSLPQGISVSEGQQRFKRKSCCTSEEQTVNREARSVGAPLGLHIQVHVKMYSAPTEWGTWRYATANHYVIYGTAFKNRFLLS